MIGGFETMDEMADWYRFNSDGTMKLTVGNPPRYVRSGQRGWQRCDHCDIEFKLWMTTNPIWQTLPENWRKMMLCTRCFRKLARKKKRI